MARLAGAVHTDTRNDVRKGLLSLLYTGAMLLMEPQRVPGPVSSQHPVIPSHLASHASAGDHSLVVPGYRAIPYQEKSPDDS